MSALKSLTSVFGMGTGGTSSPLPPEIVKACSLKTSHCALLRLKNAPSCTNLCTHFLSFTHPPHTSYLSVLRDQALDRLVLASSHITVLTPPTYLPCSLHGVLLPFGMAYLFLRSVSRLDAFSVYPIRTSLPSYAVGTTTVAPEVRPFRSSRTRNSSSHVSCAHDG